MTFLPGAWLKPLFENLVTGMQRVINREIELFYHIRKIRLDLGRWNVSKVSTSLCQ
jgi:hypothetical protein